MATIRLTRKEADDADRLPQLCMKCGVPSTSVIRRKFVWFPSWVYILILAGVLPFVIVAMILQKAMWLEIPLCDRHAAQRRRRTALIIMSLVLAGGLAMASCVVSMVASIEVGSVVFNTLMAILAVGFCILIPIAIVSAVKAIRPVEITDSSIELCGVAEGFVTALQRSREESKLCAFCEATISVKVLRCPHCGAFQG